jgi:hypothetical protein
MGSPQKGRSAFWIRRNKALGVVRMLVSHREVRMLVSHREVRMPNRFRCRRTPRLLFRSTVWVITSTIQEHPGQLALT